MTGPDLWWGSSAYTAEPAGSSSVGKPAPRGSLPPQNKDVKHQLSPGQQATRRTLTKVGLVGTAFEPDAFGAGFDQEVSHQLVGQIAN